MNPVRTVVVVAAALLMLPSLTANPILPTYDHIVVVIEENRGFSQIIGSAQAPYLNALAAGGALFTNSYALSHPSQPNYLQLFSGSNQGVTTNSTPSGLFSTPNLGSQLIASGQTFVGYSEGLPSVGFNGDNAGGASGYWRKHNPWVNFSDVPTASNRPFTDFPADFSTLPSVAFVVPTQANDMHDGTIAQGDAWLAGNLSAYAAWASANNSLLIVTFDEDDGSEGNHIVTIFYGSHIVAGNYGELINHYSVLRTIEDLRGLPFAGEAANVTTISAPFAEVPEPSAAWFGGLGLLLIGVSGRRGRRAAR